MRRFHNLPYTYVPLRHNFFYESGFKNKIPYFKMIKGKFHVIPNSYHYIESYKG